MICGAMETGPVGFSLTGADRRSGERCPDGRPPGRAGRWPPGRLAPGCELPAGREEPPDGWALVGGREALLLMGRATLLAGRELALLDG